MATPIAPTISAIRLIRLEKRGRLVEAVGDDRMRLRGNPRSSASGSARRIARRTSSTGGAPGSSLNRYRCEARLPSCIRPVRANASRDIISRRPMFRLADMRSGSETIDAAMRKSCSPTRTVSPTCSVQADQQIVARHHGIRRQRVAQRHRRIAASSRRNRDISTGSTALIDASTGVAIRLRSRRRHGNGFRDPGVFDARRRQRVELRDLLIASA